MRGHVTSAPIFAPTPNDPLLKPEKAEDTLLNQPPLRSLPTCKLHVVAATIASLGLALAIVGHAPSAHAQRAVTPAQQATAQQVAQKGVPLSELSPDAPDVYTVKKGDTLWGISAMYLKSPWRWPELWGMNQSEVRNPHLIYPGQVMMLTKTGDLARLSMGQQVGGDTIKLSPRVREGNVAEAITSVSMHLIAPFMQEMGVFAGDTLVNAPRIVATTEDRVLIGRGDNAYVMGELAETREWNVFREAKPLKDPATQEVLGYEARMLGTATYVRRGDVRNLAGKTEVVPATFTMTGVRSEVRTGDRLLPQAPTDVSTFAPHAPDKPLTGQVVSVYGDGLIAGQNQIVALNRGAREGIERGHVFAVLRDGRLITDRTGAEARPVQVKLPDERHGLMIVFRVFDRVSYALLLNVQHAVRAGDHFGMP
jgi:hypothetical protein